MDYSKLKIIQYAEQKGYEEGFPIGYTEGVKIAHQMALNSMYELGFYKGREEGKNIGREEAFIYAVKILIYKKIGFVSPNILDEINTLGKAGLEVLILELAGNMNTVDDLKNFFHIN